MPQQGKQPAAEGRLMYRITEAGAIERVTAKEAAAARIEPRNRYATATLIDGVLEVRVGATATIGGQRVVNREANVEDDGGRIEKALGALVDALGDALMDMVLRDAREDG